MPVKQVVARQKKGQFAKGASGNPKGRAPVGKTLAEAVRMVGEEKDEETGRTLLQAVIRRLFKDARGKGGERAAALLFERGFGKVTQPMDIESTQRLISINWDASLPPDDDE